MEKITYKKSFIAKLILGGKASLDRYQVLKDLCATHKNIKTRVSFNHETINYRRNKLALIKIARKNISVYFALDPKQYIGSKYAFTDVSDKKSYASYPLMLTIKTKKALVHVCELLEIVMQMAGATDLCEAEHIDYNEVYYERSFDQLVLDGFIKKYIKKRVAGKLVETEVKIELCKVNFSARLLFNAEQGAENLFILTNYANWSPQLALKMVQEETNLFTCEGVYPKGTKLEFKICRSQSWDDVEKGIWKEEIINHTYVLVDTDLEIEDLIHNFRD